MTFSVYKDNGRIIFWEERIGKSPKEVGKYRLQGDYEWKTSETGVRLLAIQGGWERTAEEIFQSAQRDDLPKLLTLFRIRS